MTICSEVLDILTQIKQIEKTVKRTSKITLEFEEGDSITLSKEYIKKEVTKKLTDFAKKIEKIRSHAQSMEDRLEKYFEAIRGLGFKRAR